MILGIGNDLINIERIENTLTKFGNRFVIFFINLNSGFF